MVTEIFSQCQDKTKQLNMQQNIFVSHYLNKFVNNLINISLWKYFSHQNLYKDHEFSVNSSVEERLLRGDVLFFFPGGIFSMKLRVDIWKAYGGELWMRGVQQHIFYFLKPNSSVRIPSSNICRSCMSRTVPNRETM